MTTVTQQPRPGDYIIEEIGLNFSRESGNLVGDGYLPAGTVLAQETDGDYVQIDFAASDGTENAKAILFEGTTATAGGESVPLTVALTRVHPNRLTWPAGATEQNKKDALAQLKTSFIKP